MENNIHILGLDKLGINKISNVYRNLPVEKLIEYEIINNKDGSSIVDGSINIYDIEENFEIEFPDERDYDTLAGFILDDIGDIPKEGEKVILNNYQFKVLKVVSNRIDKIEVQSLNND